MRIGAHVDPTDPLAEAAARDAEAVQFFLSDPQGWKAPKPREDADRLRAADVDLYVHAPYVINVATLNNRIRIPSRKLLLGHATAAAADRRQGADRARRPRQRRRRPRRSASTTGARPSRTRRTPAASRCRS